VSTVPCVVLNRPHTHAGKPCAPGDRLEVDAASAAWLLAQGVAEPDARPAKPDPESKTLKEPKP
jgi:hypothetical protein